MNTVSPEFLIGAGFVLYFVIAYVSYLIIARKRSNQATILKASLVVALGAGIVNALSTYLSQFIPGGCDLIAAILLTYHCGRSIIKIETKPAIYAALLYLGLTVVLAVLVAVGLVVMMNS